MVAFVAQVLISAIVTMAFSGMIVQSKPLDWRIMMQRMLESNLEIGLISIILLVSIFTKLSIENNASIR